MMSRDTVVSYAQNFEDVMLWRALGHVERGFYFDVGACSPDELSVTKAFYEKGWRGVNIEPNPAHHAALESKRARDVNLAIALGEQEGQQQIHLFGKTGLSTLDAEIAGRHRQDREQVVRNVAVRRLADVWRESVPEGQPVHFLKIDVEGFERKVLLGADFAVQRPWIVVVEATEPLSPKPRYAEWEKILTGADYKFVYFDGLNRFYVSNEHLELEGAFSSPPNVFDNYISSTLLECKTALSQARAQVQAGADDAREAQGLKAARIELDEAERQIADLSARLAQSVEGRAAGERLRSEAAQALARVRVEEERSRDELYRLGRENASLATHAQNLSRERDLLLSSASWRLTAPLRRVVQKVTPAQRNHIRRMTKAAWWAVTPWRLPARLRFIRDRNAALAAASAPPGTARQSLGPDETATLYKKWSEAMAASGSADFADGTKIAISFLINVGADADDILLGRTLASLRGQKQTAWQAVIFGADRARREVGGFSSLVKDDGRVVVAEQADALAAGPAAALAAARGAFVALLDAGDLLAPGALAEIATALAEAPYADILYCDEDMRDERDQRERPYLKPGFSPDLLFAFNYFGRITLLRRALALQVGGVAENANAAFEWDLNLRMSDAAQVVIRVPKVLCHRRSGSTADRPPSDGRGAVDARRTIETYWRRRGLEATATTQSDGTQSVSWPLSPEPRVSIIIPTKDKAQLLRMATTGLLHLTDYRNIELIIVDTGSSETETSALYDELSADERVQIIHFRQKFNYSAACNLGAQAARGELFLFLNNDVEVISPDWLSEMVRFAQRPGVGCVGVKLIYPSLELQHGGVALGPHLAALAYRSEEGAGFEVFGSPHHPRNWMAIMGACQMVTRQAFNSVGGFDEAYQIAMSDVALCIQLWRAGYRTAYAPAGALVHHEGATRGQSNPSEDMRRLADDIRALGIDEDPYLHPGLDGEDPTPRLRRPDGLGPREVLRRMIDQFGSYEPTPSDLDLAHEGRVLALVDRKREQALWSPQPIHKVDDLWSATRWALDLLRRRPDIRARFPQALSDGSGGAFAAWLLAEGAEQFGLPERARQALSAMFEANLGARARRAFLSNDDVRRMWPHGLTPIGNRGLFRWFIQHGRAEANLRLEEIWWLFWEASERPEREIMTAFNMTPAWQAMFPDAASPFGADRLARWLIASYRLDAAWLDPARWSFPGSAADQIRLAWQVREEWRKAYPRAARDRDAARALLDWLASGAVSMEPWVANWLRSLDLDAVAEELARPGINMIAHFLYPSGLRVSAEAIVAGVRETGLGISLRDIRTDAKDDLGHERFVGFESFDVTIIHTQPEPFFDVVYDKADLFERPERPYRIGYWYWEFDTIPDSWRGQAALVDEVWAATEFVAKGLREKLSIPVRTLFPGVRLAPFETRPRGYFGLPEGETLFLFTFHMMSIMERKNPLGLIRAFKSAFGPEDAARLVLKTSFGDRHPKQIEELRAAARDARITIIDEVYSPNDVLALMEACDVYVSLHRSEGLGLTMAEAMLMGKPVVATGYSGNMEFLNSDNSLLVDFKLTKLGRPIPPYEASYDWAEPSEAHAAELMRRLYDDPDFAAELGRNAKIDAEQRLSVKAAGERIAERLKEIRSAAGR